MAKQLERLPNFKIENAEECFISGGVRLDFCRFLESGLCSSSSVEERGLLSRTAADNQAKGGVYTAYTLPTPQIRLCQLTFESDRRCLMFRLRLTCFLYSVFATWWTLRELTKQRRPRHRGRRQLKKFIMIIKFFLRISPFSRTFLHDYWSKILLKLSTQ